MPQEQIEIHQGIISIQDGYSFKVRALALIANRVKWLIATLNPIVPFILLKTPALLSVHVACFHPIILVTFIFAISTSL